MSTGTRQATLEDLRSIAAVDREVFGDDTYPLLFFRQAIDLWPTLVVVNAGPQIAGYGLGAVGEAGDGWILSLAVRDVARGQGLGLRLTEALLAGFSALRTPSVRLTVAPDNHGAVRLYERLGFVVEREEASYFADGEPRLVMSRS